MAQPSKFPASNSGRVASFSQNRAARSQDEKYKRLPSASRSATLGPLYRTRVSEYTCLHRPPVPRPLLGVRSLPQTCRTTLPARYNDLAARLASPSDAILLPALLLRFPAAATATPLHHRLSRPPVSLHSKGFRLFQVVTVPAMPTRWSRRQQTLVALLGPPVRKAHARFDLHARAACAMGAAACTGLR